MNLIQELQNDIINSKTSLSSVLRKAKVLGSILKSEELKEWVDNELNGYPSERDIPDYRKFPTAQNLGYFTGPLGAAIKNAPIPTLNLPEPIQEFAKKTFLAQGVRALESLVEDGSPTFQIDWPANMVAIIGTQILRGYNCMKAWQVISRGQVEQVLDTVRNNLLNFILELKEKYPDIKSSEQAIANVPKGQVKAAVNTYIFGNSNIVASGTNVTQGVYQQIKKNDLESLIEYMKNIGVPSSDVKGLKRAVGEDGKITKPNKFGPKVIEWVNKMTKKVLEGTWNVAITNAPALIIEALARYYGQK